MLIAYELLRIVEYEHEYAHALEHKTGRDGSNQYNFGSDKNYYTYKYNKSTSTNTNTNTNTNTGRVLSLQ